MQTLFYFLIYKIGRVYKTILFTRVQDKKHSFSYVVGGGINWHNFQHENYKSHAFWPNSSKEFILKIYT